MRSVFVVWCVLFHGIGIFPVQSNVIPTQNVQAARGIRILSPVNKSMLLKLNDLKHILEADDIKDRYVVVVSVAGALQQRKSFLPEFLIQYLNAQYKSHDVSDWMGETKNESGIEAINWQNGQEFGSLGVWMWSEVFTHDFENGDKVAIIVLDAQGTLDNENHIHDFTSIFALNSMLSSVQCYNLMNSIDEDDLQLLNLFIEYGRQALGNSEQKPFQYILLMVRDWQFAETINYGWHGQQVIDGIFNENSNHTDEMRQLRNQIQSSFDEIAAFLLPTPGYAVALGRNFSERYQQIDPLYRQYIQDLTPTILAPENLVIKTINGEKVRAKDFFQHLQKYVKIFNEKTISTPETIFVSKSSSNYQTVVECLSIYGHGLESRMQENDTFFSLNELEELHAKTKGYSIQKCLTNTKLRDELLIILKRKIGLLIEEKFEEFRKKNEAKAIQTIEKFRNHNERLAEDIKTIFELKLHGGIGRFYLDNDDFQDLFYSAVNHALQQFDIKMLSHNHIITYIRDELERDLRGLEHIFRHKNDLIKPKRRSKWRRWFYSFNW